VTDHPPSPSGGDRPHVLPGRVLLATFAGLLALTAATVITSRLDLGPYNVVLALAIAAAKASLVGLFFMHLKYESRFQAFAFLGAVLFAALLVGFVVFDTTQYQADIRAEAAQARPAPK